MRGPAPTTSRTSVSLAIFPGVSSDATPCRAVKRAKTALKKVDGPPRVRRSLNADLTARLVDATSTSELAAAMLHVFAYASHLRVPLRHYWLRWELWGDRTLLSLSGASRGSERTGAT